jgi:arylsulfatase A-like enzyme
VPFLSNAETVIHRENTAVAWELFGKLGIRKGKWKATYISAPAGPDRWELFDLRADPGELNDLSQSEPKKLEELLVEWQDYATEVGVLGQAPEYGILNIEESSVVDF